MARELKDLDLNVFVDGAALIIAPLSDKPNSYQGSDANALGAALEQSGYEVKRVVGGEATREKIISAIRNLNERGGPSTTLLVAFVGDALVTGSDPTSRSLLAGRGKRDIILTAADLSDVLSEQRTRRCVLLLDTRNEERALKASVQPTERTSALGSQLAVISSPVRSHEPVRLSRHLVSTLSNVRRSHGDLRLGELVDALKSSLASEKLDFISRIPDRDFPVAWLAPPSLSATHSS